MSLLRYYFHVGGENFDAENFALAAIKNGFEGGTSRITSNTKKLKSGLTGERMEVKILSGISGANGDSFSSWQTALVDYAVDREIYLAARDLGLTTEGAQVWLREEVAILGFLGLVKEKLPPVAEFCKGEFFSLLKLVYGYDEEGDPGGGHHYSEKLMRILCELSAGISTDSEPFELHFVRLQQSIKLPSTEN